MHPAAAPLPDGRVGPPGLTTARRTQLGYREGPLSAGRAGALVAGDRAPDGPAGDGRRLFDVFRGPHFTLLIVGTEAEPPTFDGSPSAAVRVHRSDGDEAYGKGLFLIRPDGYIGWAGEDASRLGSYPAPLGLGTERGRVPAVKAGEGRARGSTGRLPTRSTCTPSSYCSP
ncbi:hypothetical protein ACFYPZ_05055 [Streptomyces sp. NPDC005506]|uniref:aromatic-ring hydroxylase C-terminal domain-containing protein n=1 Tax=unclassified Streptomyces TaxID=2593676 RepID=UPI0036A91639